MLHSLASRRSALAPYAGAPVEALYSIIVSDVCMRTLSMVCEYKNTFFQHHTRGGLCATPHNDNHSKSFGGFHKSLGTNEGRLCPQLVKNGTVFVLHTMSWNVLFTMPKYNGRLEESKTLAKTTLNTFYSQLNHTGTPRGRRTPWEGRGRTGAARAWCECRCRGQARQNRVPDGIGEGR